MRMRMPGIKFPANWAGNVSSQIGWTQIDRPSMDGAAKPCWTRPVINGMARGKRMRALALHALHLLHGILFESVYIYI